MRRVRFKREQKVEGRGKGEREIESEALAETEKSQTPQPGIEPKTPANERGWCSATEPPRQASLFEFYPICLHFATKASSNVHRLTRFAQGTRHGRHCALTIAHGLKDSGNFKSEYTKRRSLLMWLLCRFWHYCFVSLLGRACSKVVALINDENESFSFSFVEALRHIDRSLCRLSLQPSSGKIPPKSRSVLCKVNLLFI